MRELPNPRIALSEWESEGGSIGASPREDPERALAERLREESIGRASHDIGNRLNSIALHAQLLDRALVALGLSDELQRVRTIAEHTQRVAGMLQELLAVGSGSSESGGRRLAHEVQDQGGGVTCTTSAAGQHKTLRRFS